ncbi:SxtJ family membrane protein [Larkinella insperata]|uniref:SxtJ family membrane protein n=1 Tax=Larkinella insperata TaxID=332158 RepID=A0ABW3QN21_9BACT|nr:SxtJ family membrane protein [Larkinella insperata]
MTPVDRLKAQLVIVTGLVVLYFVFHSVYWLYAAAAVGLLSVLVPKAGNGLAWLWFQLAEGLGWINSRVLLTVLFGLVLVPIAWLYRLSKKNPLAIRQPKNASLYHERNHTYTKDDLEHPW